MSESMFLKTFHKNATHLFSAPGRTELGGNHTDHQHGRVLAAAVTLETLAWVRENDDGIIRVQSEGYPICVISLDALDPQIEERNTTAALIRGIASRFRQLGGCVRGFDAYVTSTVLPGSGLSSSAAFEVLMGTVLNHLFNGGRFSPVKIAQIGQWAENEYFGKPCGLMDQTASAVGGIITIDFADPTQPVVEQVDVDFDAAGHALYIIDSGADHADLTDEYAAVTRELKSVCQIFGESFLRDVPEEAFLARLPEVRRAAGDRGVLRALHVYADNARVGRQVQALREGRFQDFLTDVTASGRSSWMYLQNVIPCGATFHQEVALALALTEKLLQGRGAFRVHGGGFAGTILAFVPNDLCTSFASGIEAVLGSGACHRTGLRREGGILVREL